MRYEKVTAQVTWEQLFNRNQIVKLTATIAKGRLTDLASEGVSVWDVCHPDDKTTYGKRVAKLLGLENCLPAVEEIHSTEDLQA